MSLTIATDQVRPAIAALMAQCQGAELNDTIGAAASDLTRSYLASLNATRANKLGGDRTNFYAQAVRATNYRLDPDGATVQINQRGMALRYYGGQISALPPKKYLTIPACAEAYGHRASYFGPTLHFEPTSRGGALVENERSIVRRSAKTGKTSGKLVPGGRVMYWLVPSVYQNPDPTVLPTPEQYIAAITSGLEEYLATVPN